MHGDQKPPRQRKPPGIIAHPRHLGRLAAKPRIIQHAGLREQYSHTRQPPDFTQQPCTAPMPRRQRVPPRALFPHPRTQHGVEYPQHLPQNAEQQAWEGEGAGRHGGLSWQDLSSLYVLIPCRETQANFSSIPHIFSTIPHSRRVGRRRCPTTFATKPARTLRRKGRREGGGTEPVAPVFPVESVVPVDPAPQPAVGWEARIPPHLPSACAYHPPLPRAPPPLGGAAKVAAVQDRKAKKAG